MMKFGQIIIGLPKFPIMPWKFRGDCLGGREGGGGFAGFLAA